MFYEAALTLQQTLDPFAQIHVRQLIHLEQRLMLRAQIGHRMDRSDQLTQIGLNSYG